MPAVRESTRACGGWLQHPAHSLGNRTTAPPIPPMFSATALFSRVGSLVCLYRISNCRFPNLPITGEKPLRSCSRNAQPSLVIWRSPYLPIILRRFRRLKGSVLPRVPQIHTGGVGHPVGVGYPGSPKTGAPKLPTQGSGRYLGLPLLDVDHVFLFEFPRQSAPSPHGVQPPLDPIGKDRNSF